ncbi:ankyrin repeat and SOCS box protein 18-like [Amblyraja radiata]|uniref:ankyrin repeat and SOCS box protein 18-like n=1 Tax=Amblyraja radiata TaxID=386614 RepID=UPI001402B1FA|nr:ankyrin repeat and SOCS box protein 18-like [Amblyraja radiata]
MSETSSISSGSTVGSGNRVLQLASRGEWATLEQALKSIDKGDRDISHTDEDGRTALHIAAAHSKEEIIRLLLAKKWDPNLTGGHKDQLPLHFAAGRTSGTLNIVQMLLKSSNKDARLMQDKDGCIPLFLSAEASNIGVCKELLGINADLQLRTQRKDNGDTVLHVCCRKKDVELAKLMVEFGAGADFQNVSKHWYRTTLTNYTVTL